MQAEIIAVGTELLLGDIVNTNARFLSKELASLGINVFIQTTVGDNAARLQEAFARAFEKSDLVITTGGLGPTADDLTKETAAAYFGRELVMNEDCLKAIEGYFARLAVPMTENNKKQAIMPEGAIILDNARGTAPGCIIEGDGKAAILLPGPPYEMEGMFQSGVMPYLQGKTDTTFFSTTLRLCGIGESAVEDRVKDMLEKQENPTIAPYAKSNEVTLRITAKAENADAAKAMIQPVKDELYARLGEYIYGEDDATLENAVVNLLKEKGLTISLAESCTGGLLAGRITNVPGVSDVFMEGAVTYTNAAKMNRLGVKQETLDQFGAVSHETAAEMAEGIARTAQTDIGVSITGVAGPGGGTEEKPVGLVYAGLWVKGNLTTKEFHFSGDRDKIRNRTVAYVLDLIRKAVQ